MKTSVTTGTLKDMANLARYLRDSGLNVEVGKGFKKNATVHGPEQRVRAAASYLGIKVIVKSL